MHKHNTSKIITEGITFTFCITHIKYNTSDKINKMGKLDFHFVWLFYSILGWLTFRVHKNQEEIVKFFTATHWWLKIPQGKISISSEKRFATYFYEICSYFLHVQDTRMSVRFRNCVRASCGTPCSCRKKVLGRWCKSQHQILGPNLCSRFYSEGLSCDGLLCALSELNETWSACSLSNMRITDAEN